MNGDTPNIVRGSQVDFKRLFFNEFEQVLAVPVAIMAGYGVLKSGTIIAKNISAGLTSGEKGKYVPYNPTTFTGAEDHPGRAYLVTDSGTTESDLYVTMDDSYKFAVGTDVIINDDTTSKENLGAITAIDRTTELHRAKISVSTATGGTSFTTARKVYIAVEAGVAANNYSDAVGVLAASIDTGVGSNAKGAQGVIAISNAIMYTGGLVNNDAAAIVDLSMSTIGQFTVLK